VGTQVFGIWAGIPIFVGEHRARLLELHPDHCGNVLRPLVHLLKEYAHDAPPTRLEPSIPMLVVSRNVRVPVQLDDQPDAYTREIGDVGPDRVLATKLDPKLAPAQEIPHSGLDHSSVPAKVPGEVDLR
jgi:hypothetical protein